MQRKVKKGDLIRVIKMDDADGKDWAAAKMNGQTYMVDFVDDAEQIHVYGSGLAIIPEADKFEIVEQWHFTLPASAYACYYSQLWETTGNSSNSRESFFIMIRNQEG